MRSFMHETCHHGERKNTEDWKLAAPEEQVRKRVQFGTFDPRIHQRPSSKHNEGSAAAIFRLFNFIIVLVKFIFQFEFLIKTVVIQL